MTTNNVKHTGGVPFDGVNCDPDGDVLKGFDHRVCPAAIAVNTETGMEAEWPVGWPERKSADR
mgnify:FL=1